MCINMCNVCVCVNNNVCNVCVLMCNDININNNDININM